MLELHAGTLAGETPPEHWLGGLQATLLHYFAMLIYEARLNHLVTQVKTDGRQHVRTLRCDHDRLPFCSVFSLRYLSRDGVLIPADCDRSRTQSQSSSSYG